MNRLKFLAVASFVLGAASLAPTPQAWAQTSPSPQASAPPAETGPTAGQTAPPMSKGEYLARAGDCIACHSIPGGKAFTGGLKMGTPLGAIYSTNITPDKETGIGNYSFDDFDRAVRQGIGKDGHHLYPAMPYPSYAKIADDDVHALYDFFMKEVPPVKQANMPSEITGIKSWRWPLAVWNWMFMDKGVYQHEDAITMRPGIAAPISSRGWAIAALATRRAALLSRKRRSTTAAAAILDGRRARCLVRAQPARRTAHRPRRLVAGRYRGLPEDRSQRQRRRLRLDARCRQQQHALSQRRRRQCDGGLSEIAGGDDTAGGLHLRQRDDHGARRPASRWTRAARSITATASPATAPTARARRLSCRRSPAIRS